MKSVLENNQRVTFRIKKKLSSEPISYIYIYIFQSPLQNIYIPISLTKIQQVSLKFKVCLSYRPIDSKRNTNENLA